MSEFKYPQGGRLPGGSYTPDPLILHFADSRAPEPYRRTARAWQDALHTADVLLDARFGKKGYTASDVVAVARDLALSWEQRE